MMHRLAASAAGLLSCALALAAACGTEATPQRHAKAGSSSGSIVAPGPAPAAPAASTASAASKASAASAASTESAATSKAAAAASPAPTPPAIAALRAPRVTASAASPLLIDVPDGSDTPASRGCWRPGYRAPQGTRLELHAMQSASGRAIVQVALHNAGTEAVCVYSNIKTHELQNDWLTIRYADGDKYHHFSRTISLSDDRDKSYPVSLLLGPDQTLWYSIDLEQWAGRRRNGAEALPAGSVYAEAVLDASREDGVWSGQLTSESFELKVK